MDELTLQSLAVRVKRVEQVNRWLGLRMILVVFGIAWLIWSLTCHGVVEAQRFILLDSHGKPRAFLGITSAPQGGGPCLAILDTKGKLRACLGYIRAKAFGVRVEGPALMLWGPTGLAQAALNVEKGGASSLFLCNARHTFWQDISVSSTGAALGLIDHRNSARAIVSVTRARGPGVTLVNASQKKVKFEP